MQEPKELIQKVADEVVCKDNIIPFLDMVKHNLSLSAVNLAAIWSQKQDATIVCGKKAWEFMGREVCSDATPITLFFPLVQMTEVPEEFIVDGKIQCVADTDVTMYLKEAEYGYKYLSVSAYDVSETTGKEVPVSSVCQTFTDTIVDITQASVEVISQSVLGIENGCYDKEQNVFYISDRWDTDTEYGREEYNKMLLKLYVDYVFENYHVTDKALKFAVLYVLYEHYHMPHTIEQPVFMKLKNKSTDEKVEFLVQLQHIVSSIIQDFDGYYLSFNETAFVNNLLYTSECEEMWPFFDAVVDSLQDELLQYELSNLRTKLMRTEEDCLTDLVALKLQKKLFTYPAFQLNLNSTDYLREARNELFDTTEYNEEMFDW